MKVKIITDSTNDLSKDLLEKLDIEVVPLMVNFEDVTFYDGVDITTEQLYKKVEEFNQLPKTAAVPIPTFIDIFEKYVKEGYEVVYTGISRQMSRTFENAYMAAIEVDEEKVHVVDSMNLSTGIGLLLMKAAKYRDQGMSGKEIAERLNKDNKRVLSQFAVETMDYLHKGGRCSSLAKIFGTFLKIKPIIAVRDGKMSVASKPRGRMKVALDELINQLKEDLPRLDKDAVIITHSIAFEHEEYIRTQLQEFLGDVPLYSTVAGCVISSHCGQGTIGILYMINEE